MFSGAFATLYAACSSTSEDILRDSLEGTLLSFGSGNLFRVMLEAQIVQHLDHIAVIGKILIGLDEH
jgi:hypothetical protein